ncbi:Xaa-Pro dipeptidyl-peptidase [Actinoplanes sp. TBRC 11911]|uniref:Xaa-Pro dipeptidyl-peptidase n=1 Tax=Actinoplanes sp. TBRC 11911 TaxID=2729386 RepID=UPI00145E7FB2|nr:Xaa-Pro dipeptidyl-peptidase [Actinoplanes sp. TBRC 11911]NMO50761.1 Xaa-Pro dipeptidyl-peptidase [Actinoplanes sp. TBRC 11911]
MSRRLVLAVVAALGATLALTATPAHAGNVPHIRGTETVPAYSYADAVRESVWVQTNLDNDADGVRDRVAVDIVRPRAGHVRVPVVMEGSPYYKCCGRGNENEKKTYDANGVIASQPLFYDNYFVPRGYAFVAADLAGTSRSTGCEDVGGREEVQSAKAVIDWLNGRAKAFHADGSPAVATGWTNGKVGMIGKSWDGSVANGVAATGVEGLETIVPISAISSWYDYQRYNGILRSEDYPEYLHGYVNGRPAEACADVLAKLDTGSDDATGDYNAYWAQRNYRPSARSVHASVFLVHGINDTNVTTTQFGQWWNDLRVPKKIWLSQMGHVDPFDIRRDEWVDTLHRWFDRYLQGLHNGIDREPAASIETAPGTWENQRTWPVPGAHPVRVALGDGDGTTGTLGGSSGSGSSDSGSSGGGSRTWLDVPTLRERTAVATPNVAVAGRQAFLSAPLTGDVRLSGTPSATLRVKVDKPTTSLTARLVDYGSAARINYQASGEGITKLTTESCWGESTAADNACYFDTAENVVTANQAILTRGWQDAAHHVSLRFTTPLKPDRWYSITVPMQPTDQIVKAGHTLGLILQQTDNDYTSPTPTGATVTLDLRGSSLSLPLVGKSGLPKPSAVPATVQAPAPAEKLAPAQPFRPIVP